MFRLFFVAVLEVHFHLNHLTSELQRPWSGWSKIFQLKFSPKNHAKISHELSNKIQESSHMNPWNLHFWLDEISIFGWQKIEYIDRTPTATNNYKPFLSSVRYPRCVGSFRSLGPFWSRNRLHRWRQQRRSRQLAGVSDWGWCWLVNGRSSGSNRWRYGTVPYVWPYELWVYSLKFRPYIW